MSQRKFQRRLSLTALCAAAAVSASLLAMPVQAAEQARVIISYKAGNAALVQAVVARLGGRVVVDLDEVDAMAVVLPRAAVAALRASRNVESVEEDAVRSIQGGRSAKAVNLTPSGTQTVPYGITMVQADQLTGTPLWRPTVCIVDSGINATHEDLVGNTLSGKNYTTSGTWDSDENSHGTHVAGTIAAVNNQIGVIGVAGDQQLKLRISKVFDAAGSASSSTIAKGMLGCLLGKANVVSMSLGGSRANSLEQKVVDLLTARGLLLIAAAGNAGTSDVSYPAGFTNVMSVAAIDASKVVASFSQFNADVEIAGPGVSVLSTVPQGSQLGGTLTVASTAYTANAIEGSPLTSASGPLADFGIGDTPVAGSMSGKVCLISRGSIAFGIKVQNCETSGGVGAVIYNNDATEPNFTLGDTVTNIPSVGVTQASGALLVGQLGASATVGVGPSDAKYASYSGTSMSTPHVSAVAGLVWSYYPACSATQIRSALNSTAQDLGDPGRDIHFGYGLVQAKAAFDYLATHSCN